jgi:hypothetical protein
LEGDRLVISVGLSEEELKSPPKVTLRLGEGSELVFFPVPDHKKRKIRVRGLNKRE